MTFFRASIGTVPKSTKRDHVLHLSGMGMEMSVP